MKLVLFLLLGLVLIWAGATGRLGLMLAALFTPSEVVTNGGMGFSMPSSSNPNQALNGGFASNSGGR